MLSSKGLQRERPWSAGRFSASPHRTALRRLILTLALMLCGHALAAGFTCPPSAARDSRPAAKTDLAELDEVVVTPDKVTSRTADLSAWLRRLEGQYSYEGYVDLCGNGTAAEQRPVTGKADCVALLTDSLVSVYCAVNVRWPTVHGENGAPVLGGESHLSPAVIVYGVVPDMPGIQFMQIDNKGIATHARGTLVGNTLTTTESCGLPGHCRKFTRITANPDSTDVAILVDVAVDSRRVLRHAFLLHRVSNMKLSLGGRSNDGSKAELGLVGER